MCVPQGIITVVDESPEQEDEALTTLRGLTKFEPLIVPEQPSHFSLASVFGALSTAAGPKSASFDLTFNPAVLVDILVQINAHNKKCAQDIQGFQRSLALKMKGLDEYTYTAVKDLGNVQQEAKSQSDHLLSVHALVRQANTTTELLHEIVQKIQGIAATLPADADAEVPSPEKYPNLYRYLQQTPTSPTVNRKSMEANAGTWTYYKNATVEYTAISNPHIRSVCSEG
ncbi:hypothetical protein BGX31_009122 [Mortierella sp. GBA43]|nr:hypothetical protein BGX31_009122 [Mortierella sp. GBA43]